MTGISTKSNEMEQNGKIKENPTTTMTMLLCALKHSWSQILHKAISITNKFSIHSGKYLYNHVLLSSFIFMYTWIRSSCIPRKMSYFSFFVAYYRSFTHSSLREVPVREQRPMWFQLLYPSGRSWHTRVASFLSCQSYLLPGILPTHSFFWI